MFKAILERFFIRAWYQGSFAVWLFYPFTVVYRWLAEHRRQQYLSGDRVAPLLPVPVVIVGNITVGGTGKTPLVISLVESLRERGLSPGVISRGYGGKASSYPCSVEGHGPEEVGDEPFMIAERTGVPVVVDPDRVAAAQKLIAENQVDVIISDDGLQHYRLGRNIEIVVIDGQRGLGNHQCLPVGPLREPEKRLESVDYIIINRGAAGCRNNVASDSCNQNQSRCDNNRANGYDGFERYGEKVYQYTLSPEVCVRLDNSEEVAAAELGAWSGVCAIAGIGNPRRFYDTLADLGVCVQKQLSFPDHHLYSAEDFRSVRDMKIVMTEKDAVKARNVAPKDSWYLKVSVNLNGNLADDIVHNLQVRSGKP